MKNLALFLRLRLRKIAGLQVEIKQATVAVHYRGATPEEHSVGRRAILQLVRQRKDLRLMSGKKVWEILRAGPVDKWSAVEMILEREGFPASNTLAVHIGDDLTDESVFRKLSGIPIAVGNAGPTAASFRLDSHREVHEFLERWKKLIRAARRAGDGLS